MSTACRSLVKRSLIVEQLESRRLLAFNPSPVEQEFLQLTNRLRTEPAGEFARLFSSAAPLSARDSIFQSELDFFGVQGNTLKSELQALSPQPPLAWTRGPSYSLRPITRP